MVFYDSKYDVDEETAKLPSTVEFFPDMVALEDDFDNETKPIGEIMSDWGRRKLGTLQSELEKTQFAREAKHFGSKYNLNNFSRSILYGLANKVFGYNGWSTALQTCLVQELEVEEEGKYSTRCSVEIRLILSDGTYMDANGIAESTNMPYKFMSYQTSKKKAVTEAMKNAITGIPYLCLQEDVADNVDEFDMIERELQQKYGI